MISCRIPYKVLFDHSVDLKMLSRFIVLKRFYTNSVVYDYSARSLSARIKKQGLHVSATTINRWVNYFIKEGWAYFDLFGNLRFGKVSSITKQKARKSFSITYNSVQTALKSLYLELMKAKSRQCSFAKVLTEAIGRNVSFKQEKISAKLIKKLKHGPANDVGTLRISADGLARLFRTSRATALRIARSLDSVVVKTSKSLVCKGSSKGLNYLQKQGTWSFKGFIYKREMNEYSFSLA